MQTQHITSVALHLLKPSPRNVRPVEKADKELKELAASIAAEGLLQGLVVTEHENGGARHYEVEAGGRRLAAMRLLAKEGRLDASAPIPVTVISVEQATSASLAENTARKAMHAADQLVAFKALVDQGKTVEEVAARFGVVPKVVERRLKLANCAPFLIEELRADRMSLEVLMAFAITDDHAAQAAVWKGLAGWQRGRPEVIRQLLTKDEVSSAEDPQAKFVGVKAYQAAGGRIRRDLFSDSNECYLQDVSILQKLATDKLVQAAEALKASEGWSWVLPTLTLDYSEANRYGRVSPTKRAATSLEARALKELRTEYEGLCEQDELTDVQEERREELYGLIEKAEDGLLDYGPKQKAKAGVIVSIDCRGQLDVRRGLIRPEDVKAAKKKAKAKKGAAVDDQLQREYSADLTRSLSASFTAALQAQVATKPQVALALLVHSLLGNTRMNGVPLLQVRVDAARLQVSAADIEESIGAKALSAATEKVNASVPDEGALALLLGQSVDQLLERLAVLVAPGINAVTAEAALDSDARVAARAAALNLTDWWKPTGENFFKRIGKEQLAAAAREALPEDKAGEIAKLPRKGDMVTRLEAELKDSTWLPKMLRS